MDDSALSISNQARGVIEKLLELREEHDPRISLKITLKDSQGFALKEFANYLDQIDRFYGRLAVGSLRSYSRSDRRLRFDTVYPAGSFEVVVDIIDALKGGSATLLLAWLLAILPKIAEAIPKAYKTIEEAKLIREERRQIEIETARARDQGQHPADQKGEVLADQAKIGQSLRDIDFYDQLDEDTRKEIRAILAAAVIKEFRVNSSGAKKAYVYNGIHLERIVLVVRPGPNATEPGARTISGEIMRIEIPVVTDTDIDLSESGGKP